MYYSRRVGEDVFCPEETRVRVSFKRDVEEGLGWMEKAPGHRTCMRDPGHVDGERVDSGSEVRAEPEVAVVYDARVEEEEVAECEGRVEGVVLEYEPRLDVTEELVREPRMAVGEMCPVRMWEKLRALRGDPETTGDGGAVGLVAGVRRGLGLGVCVGVKLCDPGNRTAERRVRLDEDAAELAASIDDLGSEKRAGVGVASSGWAIVGVVSLSELGSASTFGGSKDELWRLSPEVPKADNDLILLDGGVSISISTLPRSRGGTLMLSVRVPVRVCENEWCGRAMICSGRGLPGDEIL